MVRARGSHPRGHWFESSIAHQLLPATLIAVLAVGALPPIAARAADPTDVNSLGLTATYDVHATFRWDARTAVVRTNIGLTNRVRWSVSSVALNLATLRTAGARLEEVLIDGSPVDATIDDQTILVTLPTSLAPGASTRIAIAYSARPAARASAEGDAWEFALIDDVLSAYRWIPWLSRTTPFDRPNVGDPFVTASSPHVRVAIESDTPVVIASSGVRLPDEGGAQVFEAREVRDFNFAASPSYRTTSRDVGGTRVTVFYRTLHAKRILAVAARAIRAFSVRIGPYPHAQLTIAEIGPWAPFESPAHFWLPNNAGRLLDWMTAHEVAHQWFYSAVGNDQARQPFADEALADFIARDLLSRFVDSPCPEGRLDHSIYDIRECYAWVIYVQGDAWLLRLRRRIGASRFWSALANYYARNRNAMGSTYEVLASFGGTGGMRAVDFDRFPRTYPARVISLPFGPALL